MPIYWPLKWQITISEFVTSNALSMWHALLTYLTDGSYCLVGSLLQRLSWLALLYSRCRSYFLHATRHASVTCALNDWLLTSHCNLSLEQRARDHPLSGLTTIRQRSPPSCASLRVLHPHLLFFSLGFEVHVYMQQRNDGEEIVRSYLVSCEGVLRRAIPRR
jgi:hypothetical protein